MTIDIPGKKIFVQRDVRETPAATATATSVGLTDPHYLVLQTDADLTNERVLTAGEGLNFTDTGANGTLTINGENASDSNKGIAKFQLSDFSVSSGDVSLKAVVVMSVDGDSGTATPAVNNLDILGGNGISTAGSSNDITITNDGVTSNVAGAGIDVSGATGDVTISIETASTTNVGGVELATINETQTGTDTTRAVTPDGLQAITSPIGAVIAWLKSFTNTPALAEGWVECNGQTLSDAESVYNGQVIPNLNGNNNFLRGNSTSGGTGGEETHALTETELAAHDHTFPLSVLFGTSAGGVSNEKVNDAGAGQEFAGLSGNIATVSSTNDAGSGDTHENRPPFYNVVWIMRIK